MNETLYKMKFLRTVKAIIFLYLAIVLVLVNGSPTKKNKLPKRIRHERIQPAGGTIGFIKPKYHKDRCEFDLDDKVSKVVFWNQYFVL